jgi:hypothetical protein
MNGILGLRAEQAAVHWAIVEGTLNRPILHAHGTEVAPESYNEGESLVWIRKRLVYIIDTFKPAKVAVRYPEGNAQGANKDWAKARCRVEGVVLEAAGSGNLPTVTGAMSTFGKHSQSNSPKEELKRDDLRGLDWSNHKDSKLREAIFVAASLLPKG